MSQQLPLFGWVWRRSVICEFRVMAGRPSLPTPERARRASRPNRNGGFLDVWRAIRAYDRAKTSPMDARFREQSTHGRRLKNQQKELDKS